MRVPVLTYTLGRSLYVPLTSRCNSLTLPETRGPGFLLPAEVVATLLRVRDLEYDRQQWHHWCMYLDTQEHPQKLPAAVQQNEDMASDNNTRLPSIESLQEQVQEALVEQPDIQAIVIGGEGEPTLRFHDLLSLARKVADLKNSPPIRVTTNGLVVPSIVDAAEQLKSSGVQAVSVALMTADPVQYNQLMEPRLEAAHSVVCDFIQDAVQCKLQVEVTAVERPNVNKEETEQLATALGVTDPVRWRPYFD